jgi:hypothetical protein
MNTADYVSLNVPGLLAHYSNPSPEWRAIVLAWSETQLAVFEKHGLIKKDAAVLRQPLEERVVKFSDYTPSGQAFVQTGAVDKWLAACDKRGSVSAYKDSASLEKRVLKFLKGAR